LGEEGVDVQGEGVVVGRERVGRQEGVGFDGGYGGRFF
jgi:hypothetical protein